MKLCFRTEAVGGSFAIEAGVHRQRKRHVTDLDRIGGRVAQRNRPAQQAALRLQANGHVRVPHRDHPARDTVPDELWDAGSSAEWNLCHVPLGRRHAIST